MLNSLFRNLSKLKYIGRLPELFRARTITPNAFGLANRYLALGNPQYPYRVAIDGGSVMLSSREEVKVFWQIYIHGCYSLPVDCKLIVDAGANIGLFSIWAARKAPAARLLSLEPSPATYEALGRNVRDNELAKRISTFPLALAGTTGPREMRVSGDSPNHMLVSAGAGHEERTVPIECETLASFFDLNKIKTIDLLKMDIEGAEYEVLQSTSHSVLGRVAAILLEYHDVGPSQSISVLLDHLAEAGHHVVTRSEDAFGTGVIFLRRAAGSVAVAAAQA
jgi:FkbM family methyltransferase